MAKLIYALNQSLDGYVDHDHPDFQPDPALFQHFTEDVRSLAGFVYGRRMYEAMRYWDEDRAEWGEAEWAYAQAWRARPKWIVSATLGAVGPNATLIARDPQAAVADLKAQHDGDIEVAGPQLAAGLSGFIDEYRLYIHPVVLGAGQPFFAGPRPPLRLTAHERIGRDVIRLTYVPA